MLLPMIQALDNGSGVIVKCAVIIDKGDCWVVKPLDEANFDPQDFLSNKAMHYAWWQIAKSDLSAEPITERFDAASVHRLARERVEVHVREARARAAGLSSVPLDCDGHPYVWGDVMSKRQYFTHGGPGWDFRMGQPEYNWRTDQVENDEPYEPWPRETGR